MWNYIAFYFGKSIYAEHSNGVVEIKMPEQLKFSEFKEPKSEESSAPKLNCIIMIVV